MDGVAGIIAVFDDRETIAVTVLLAHLSSPFPHLAQVVRSGLGERIFIINKKPSGLL